MTRYIGPRIHLRRLTVADVTDAYVGWINDPVTRRYLETRFRTHSRADVEAFVAARETAELEPLFGLFLNDGDVHVGNLKIGPIDPHHRTGPLSYLLGEPSARGRGLATEAVMIGVEIAFRHLGVIKLTAGTYAGNAASARVLSKAGFRTEGRRAEYFAFEGGRADLIEYGLLAHEHRPGLDLTLG